MNLIIGAGLTGLSTGYHLNHEYIIFEKEKKVGGLARSIYLDKFIFDYSIHALHIQNDYTLKLAKKLLGDDLFKHQRKAGIFFDGKIIPYPFQMNLYHLSPEKKKECLIGAIKAKYESKIENINNFYEWILASWGEGIGKYFMFPYNKKLWTVDLRTMTTEWLGDYVQDPDIEKIIDGAISESTENIGYNAEFWYPKESIEELPTSFLPHINNLKLNTKVEQIDLDRKTLIANGFEYEYRNIISTMPLVELGKIINPVPPKIQKAFNRLKCNSISVVLLGIARSNLLDQHWLYFPEEDKIFHRIYFPSNFSKFTIPKRCDSIAAEISHMRRLNSSPGKVIEKVISDLKKCSIINEDDTILIDEIINIKYAYVIYDNFYQDNLERIKGFLEDKNIYSIGRYGGWEYSAMEDAILQGKEIAEKLNEKQH